MSNLEAHVVALEGAQGEGKLPENLADRVIAMADAIRATRPVVAATLAAPVVAPAKSHHAPIEPARAPAIIRSRAEMETAELIETDLTRYLGPKGILAFLNFANLDGTPKPGDAPLPTMDKMLRAFNPEVLEAARKLMENAPRLTLGPDYGDDQLNFVAMVLAMNAAEGRTPQTVNAYVNTAFGSITPSALEGKPIKGYRPTLIDGTHSPNPYSHDNLRLPWAQRLALRQAFLKGKPIQGTDRLDFADLMGASLAGQEPVDSSNTYTVFEADKALTPSLVPLGGFRDGQPDFDVHGPGVFGGDVRFRSVLRGDVLK